DDHRVGDGLGLRLPAAVAFVVGDRDDHGLVRRVRSHCDLALQRLAISATEVTERLGANAPHAGVAVLRVDDLALALVLDVRELQLLAEDGRELVERDVDLEGVFACALPGLLSLAALFALLSADRIAGIAVTLTRAALLLVAEAEARDVDLRDGD